MRNFGWRSTFCEKEWGEVRSFLAGVSWKNDEAKYLFDIIDSVVSSGEDDVLAVTTSMHDLVVAPKPAHAPPLEVVRVCAPSSMHHHGQGTVRIEHISVNGKDTNVVRPADEAVALFWRFLDVEFGLRRSGPTGAVGAL